MHSQRPTNDCPFGRFIGGISIGRRFPEPVPNISGTKFAIDSHYGIQKRTIAKVFAHGGFVVCSDSDRLFTGLRKGTYGDW
jgi:hypothetical protein